MSSIQNYAVLLLVGGCLFGAESAPAKSFHHSLKVPRFARNEPAPELYSTLANYYHARQLEFKLRAKNEHHEWVRRSEFFASPLLKYPEPEISSRYRYEYFAYEAQEMNRLAEHYEQLAMQASEDRSGRDAEHDEVTLCLSTQRNDPDRIRFRVFKTSFVPT